MTPGDIHQEFKDVLLDFQREVIPMLRQNLLMQKYQYTGRLYSDLSINLEELGDQLWQLHFHMPEYGRYLDKKRPFAAYASAEDLARWISAKGLANFTSIPGYENSGFIPADAPERIAWAIIRSKPKIPNRFRSLNNPFEWQWFHRPFFGLWADKRETLLNVFFDKVPESVAQEVARTYQQAVSGLAKA